MVRASGLHARPLLIVIPTGAARGCRRESTRGRRDRSRRGSSIEPTQKRPDGIALAVVEALLGRVVGRDRRGWLRASLAGSKRQMPSRNATTKLPSRAGAEAADVACGNPSAPARRVAGSKRLISPRRNVAVPERLLLGVPERRSPSSAAVPIGDANVHGCSAHTTAMSSFIDASSVARGERAQAVRGRVGHVDRVARRGSPARRRSSPRSAGV